jgi:hypothetical protein
MPITISGGGSPAGLNLTVNQGATFSMTFTWLQDDGMTPVNLTGFTAEMQVREQAGGTLLTTFTTTDGSITLGGTAGTIVLLASATTTGGWQWDGGYYDLHLTDGFGEVTTLLAGLLNVIPAITT